jgi:hypothetical protein
MRHATRFLVPVALAAAFSLAGCGGADEDEPGSSATVVYVDATVVGGLNTGTSWANAYTSLATALANAPTGAQVWIRAGTYKPTTTTDRTISFTIDRRLSLYGGFAGTETAVSQRDLSVRRTVLSGDIGASDTHRVVWVNAADVVIDGVEVVGASGATGTSTSGAGIYVAAVTGLVLRDVVIRDNTNAGTDSHGAGLVVNGATGITANRVVIAANTAFGNGAGVYLAPGSAITMTNCLVTGSTITGTGDGPAIRVNNASLSLINCTIFNNDDDSEAVIVTGTVPQPATLNILNCLFDQNSGGSLDISGTITTQQATYTRFESAIVLPGFSSNYTAAIVYVASGNPDGADDRWATEDDGLRLNAAGSTGGVNFGTSFGAPTIDITGMPRSGLPDLGAYEKLPSGGG